MLRHPLSALFILIAAWTQVLAPVMMTCVAESPFVGQVPICHAGTPAQGSEDLPATPAEHTCIFCVVCHAAADVPRMTPVVASPLRIAVATPWQPPANAVLRREALTRARARAPPTLV